MDNNSFVDTPKRRRRGVTLKTPDDVRRLLCRLINRLLTDSSDANISVLRTVSYSATVMLKVFEISDLEDRLKALEKAYHDDKKPH